MSELDAEVLIVGAGPAGATLALLLAKHYGIHSIVLARHRGTANTPRAHIFNQRAMEVMRDLSLEGKLTAISSSAADMAHTSWLHSLTGREYGRLWSWGNDPLRKGEYESSSPCSMSDLPQSYLEPVLVDEGIKHGVTYCFRTEFVSFVEETDHVRVLARSRDTGQERVLFSRYLVGADGARSSVLTQLGIPVDGRQLNNAFNVHIKADMTRYFQHRPGSLNWILNPEAPEWSAVGNFRMVRPWTEFVVSMHPSTKNGRPFEPTHEDIKRRLYQMIGEDTVDIQILSSYQWTINDQLARSWQKGRVMCIGDATHRHPPINGLGSNTCISDAFNLAWKLAFVVQGHASERLLGTLTEERRPVGESIVRRANEGMEVHRALWQLIGLTKEAREVAMQTMESATREGQVLRERFNTLLDQVDDEVQAVGIQMNQLYIGSGCTVAESDDGKLDLTGVNLLKKVVKSTYPGCHLPHVWIVKNSQSEKISTLDLVGRGSFTLLTGIGGTEWVLAAESLAERLPIRTYSIGIGCDYMDAYREWTKVRGISDDGAVLVRPDHFVAWRTNGLASGHISKLEGILSQCLGYNVRDT
ncbi:hypothetical protein BT93_L4477 [Corymbia citriodora subsp. variegata]|uniref:FAD-binding domain-containing protein n=1 Tax=Corymbia citriodora subsp. variegata TaxID=360336 RepID=A0A8T0CGX4_CORYI|nr:hypothetical protein BT93_L4477 [Corymbia citriodora subsp. variegata]